MCYQNVAYHKIARNHTSLSEAYQFSGKECTILLNFCNKMGYKLVQCYWYDLLLSIKFLADNS